jgi:hypothetical protein
LNGKIKKLNIYLKNKTHKLRYIDAENDDDLTAALDCHLFDLGDKMMAQGGGENSWSFNKGGKKYFKLEKN